MPPFKSRDSRRRKKLENRFAFETLEARHLLAADAFESLSLSLAQIDAAKPQSFVFIDSSVDNHGHFLAAKSPSVEVVVVDAGTDGFKQIGEVLSAAGSVESIQVISHGAQGALTLGSRSIAADNLLDVSTVFHSWGESLTPDASILLYGCNIARGASGRAFIDAIAQHTGAIVAASDNLTGAEKRGGDWQLEYSTGTFNTGTEVFNDYDGVLFKPYTHVAVGREVVEDLKSGRTDGQRDVSIPSATSEEPYDTPVPGEVANAILNHPEFYYAGTIGPDGFPDFAMGQSVIHTTNNGRWLRHTLDQAWKAQTNQNANNDGRYDDDEKQQILAYAYGVLTHSAGDIWSHTLVNEFATGVFPELFDGVDTDEAQEALAHILVENYIVDATPGFDGNPLESNDVLERDGLLIVDVTDDTSESITLPTNESFNGSTGGVARFIYESSIAEQPTIAGLPDGRGAFIDFFSDLKSRLLNERQKLSTPDEAISELVDSLTDLGTQIANEFKSLEDLKVDLAKAERKHAEAVEDFNDAGDDLSDAKDELDRAGRKLSSKVRKLRRIRSACSSISLKCAKFIGDSIFDLSAGLVSSLKSAAKSAEKSARAAKNAASGVVKEVEAAIAAAGAVVDSLDEKLNDLGDLIDSAERALDRLQRTVESLYEGLIAEYIDEWVIDIDAGLKVWPEFGLRMTRALFDPETRRNVQDSICEGEDGLDRQTCERAVGLVDVVLYEVDTPPGYGDGESFVDNHLLSMLGAPDFIGEARAMLREANAFLGGVIDEVLAPIRELIDEEFDPLEALEDELKQQINKLIKQGMKETFGVDIDQFSELIHSPSSKLGLRRLGSGAFGFEVPLFQAGDREKLDRYMGLITDPGDDGTDLHAQLDIVRRGSDLIPGSIRPVDFHRNAVGRFHDNVEFVPSEFPAFANAVTMSKLLLLDGNLMNQFLEDAVDNEFAFDIYPDGYAGNIMLTTLAKDDLAETNYVPRTEGTTSVSNDNIVDPADPSNQTQWIRTIDGDHHWQSGREPIFVKNANSSLQDRRTRYASAGNGNFPLFEDCRLRTLVFRDIFSDWENDLADNGILDRSLVFPDFTDTFDTSVECPTGEPTLFVVDTLVDEDDGDISAGNLSLREAIRMANEELGANRIVFELPETETQQMIELSGGELLISGSTSLIGPGSNRLLIQGDGKNRVFKIDDGELERVLRISIEGISIANTSAQDGGAIFTEEELSLQDVVISDSSATASGGAIYANAQVTLADGRIVNTSAADDGGAIAINNAPLVIVSSELLSNRADANGGAIFAVGEDVSIQRSTLANNTAIMNGGGIYLANGRLTSVETTIYANTGDNGGGLWLQQTDVNLSGNTIVENHATKDGGGIYNQGDASVLLSNSIVSMNTAGTLGPDILGRVNAFTNVIGSSDNAEITGTNNQIGVDPMLRGLGYHGGQTQTATMRGNSPGEDKGLSFPQGAASESLLKAFDFQSLNGIVDRIEGEPTITKGPANYGNAIHFSGDASDYIELNDPLSIGNSFHTVSVWVKVPEAAPDSGLTESDRVGIILGNYSEAPNANWEIYDEGQVRLYWNNGELDLRGTNTDLRDNQWHHLAFVRRQNGFEIYIDGVIEPIEAIKGSLDTPGSNLEFDTKHRIGLDQRSSQKQPFHGSIDELSIYNRALTQEEVIGLHLIPNTAATDQRGIPRILEGRLDIGAVEFDFEMDADTDNDEILNIVDNCQGIANPDQSDDDADGVGDVCDRTTYVVDISDSTSDGVWTAGNLSLREAVELANLNPGPNTIQFDLPSPSNINLDNGCADACHIDITDDISLFGTTELTISSGNSRIFAIDGLERITPVNVTLRDFSFKGNVEGDGGVLLAEHANVTIKNSTIRESLASDRGGAIAIRLGGTLTLEDSEVTENRANQGGALFVGQDTSVSILRSTLDSNIGRFDSANWWERFGKGGAVFGEEDAGVTVDSSTISNNTAHDGGGIYAESVTLINSTLSGNIASANYPGVYGGELVDVTFSTIVGNESTNEFARYAGFIDVDTDELVFIDEEPCAGLCGPGTTNIKSSVVAANISRGDVWIPETNFVYPPFEEVINVITPARVLTSHLASELGGLIHPQLSNNGGPTLTHDPFPTGPAIDGGATVYHEEVKRARPVAYWRFNSPTADAETGVPGPKLSKFGFVNTDSSIPGISRRIEDDCQEHCDYAVRFSQRGAFLSAPNSSEFSLHTSHGFSIEFWYQSRLTGRTIDLVTKGEPTDGTPFYTLRQLENGQLDWTIANDQGESFTATSVGSITDGNWHHVVATYEPSNRVTVIHLDGVPGTASENIAEDFFINNEASLIIGGFDATGGDVRMDELAIYKRVLSSNEIGLHAGAAVAAPEFDQRGGEKDNGFPRLQGPRYDAGAIEIRSRYLDEDNDNDSIINEVDNCIGVPNPDQLDSDADGLGDACDTTTYTVDSLADVDNDVWATGDLTLREAVKLSNLNPGPNEIIFDLGNRFNEIVLTEGQLNINGELSISGSGATNLALSGNQESRIFFVNAAKFSLSGITLQHGNAERGGAILAEQSELSLVGVDILDNEAEVYGGGIAADFSGHVEMRATNIARNSAGDSGGGLSFQHSVTASISTTNIVDNETILTSGHGGGIAAGDLVIRYSTIANNKAGNGAAVSSDGHVEVENSTLAENEARTAGAALLAEKATIIGSTIANNHVIGNAQIDAIDRIGAIGGEVDLYYSIVGGNTFGDVPFDLAVDASPNVAISASSAYNIIGNADSAANLGHAFNRNHVGNGGSGTLDLATVLDLELRDHDGFTKTYAVLRDGIAFDAVPSSYHEQVFESEPIVNLWFEETGLESVFDLTDNGNDVRSLVNTTVSDNGFLGQAIGFDGSAFVDLNLQLNANASDFSIELAINPTTLPDGNSILVQQADGDGTGRSLLYINQAHKVSTFFGGVFNEGTTVLEENNWYHITLTIAQGENNVDEIKIYVNGQLESTANVRGEDASGNWLLGTHKDLRNYYTGLMDEFAVYDQALPAETIQSRNLVRNAATRPAVDQRFTKRSRNFGMDIGAYEFETIGDTNRDREVDSNDIDFLCNHLNATEPRFDIDGDGTVNLDDVDMLIRDILDSNYGDSNLDGLFNSSDLITVFASGEYEDGISQNSSWQEGDWNCDREFDSSDLIFVFQKGTYLEEDIDEDGGEIEAAEVVAAAAPVADRGFLTRVAGSDVVERQPDRHEALKDVTICSEMAILESDRTLRQGLFDEPHIDQIFNDWDTVNDGLVENHDAEIDDLDAQDWIADLASE